jgi:hypothetical protein
MTRRSRTRQSRAVEIDGSKSLPFLWSRFSSELTTKSRGRKLYRDLIINNFVSCSIVGPITHRDVTLEIARQSHKAIPVASLPDSLNALLRGYVAYGLPGNYFDRIAKNYQGMHWWMSESGLNMEILVSANDEISPFDDLAGKLMNEAWLQRLPNGRLLTSHYVKIFAELDLARFRPLDFLTGEFRKKLANWNQKNPNQAIHSFTRLFNSKQALPRRGILKRLNRAKSLWIKVNKMSAL